MSIEPATLTMTGLIATGLSLIFAIAAHSTSKKRQRERAHLEATLRAQRPPPPNIRIEPSIVATPIVQAAIQAADVVAVRTQPAVTMTAERPRAVVPAPEPPAPVVAAATVAAPAEVAPPPRVPPPPPGPPSFFKQYVTRPGTKTTTPVVETPPTDKDYVWE